MGTYLVIDGNSLTYRAFFALPTDMATASGQVTNAVFGFTSMLINVMKDHTPDGVLVTFDRPEPTFRHEAEPLYKAQREAAPDILRQQMGLVREVLDAIGITTIDLAGWEADDLIATATDRLVDAGHQVIIVTGDRDSYQLVRDPDVKVLYNKRGVSDYGFYDEAGIEERTGVRPELYAQYAALRGDSSDNLPGVPGVGEKTAAKLINTYGGLDGIFEHVAEQTPKLRESLTEHEQRARKNFELMLLRHDAPARRPRPRRSGCVAQPRRAEAPVRVPRVPDAGRPARRGALGDGHHGRPRTRRRPRGTGRRGDDRLVVGAGRSSDRGCGDHRRRRHLGRRARPEPAVGHRRGRRPVDGRGAVDPGGRAGRRRRAVGARRALAICTATTSSP